MKLVPLIPLREEMSTSEFNKRFNAIAGKDRRWDFEIDLKGNVTINKDDTQVSHFQNWNNKSAKSDALHWLDRNVENKHDGSGIKGLTEAAKADDSKLYSKIEKLTNSNNHTEAVAELAIFLKDTKRIKILNALLQIQKLEGSTPTPISKYREQVRQELLDDYAGEYGKTSSELLDGAF